MPGKSLVDYDYHLYYVPLLGSKISAAPTLVDLPIPPAIKPNYCTFAANGNVYFSAVIDGDSKIFRCVYQTDHYLKPEKLLFDKSQFVDFDPAVARDESFIVFSSNNRKGVGGSDLWVTFRKGDTWTEPANLGSKINTRGTDGSAGLSRDNQTLYFSSSRESIKAAYRLYPLNTSEILKQLHGYKNGLRNIYENNIPELSFGTGKRSKSE